MKLLPVAVVLGVASAFAPSMPKFHRTNAFALNVASSPEHNGVVFDDLSGDKFSSASKERQMADEMIEPDYKVATGLASVGAAIMGTEALLAAFGHASLFGVAGGLFHVLLGGAIAFQTARVRCVFDRDGFEFYNVNFNGVKLEPKPGNFQTGLKNRWAYNKITNYGFLPSNDLPVLLYFKETQTPKKYWKENIAFFDIAGGGQPHLLPAIFDANKFEEQLQSRGVNRMEDLERIEDL